MVCSILIIFGRGIDKDSSLCKCVDTFIFLHNFDQSAYILVVCYEGLQKSAYFNTDKFPYIPRNIFIAVHKQMKQSLHSEWTAL